MSVTYATEDSSGACQQAFNAVSATDDNNKMSAGKTIASEHGTYAFKSYRSRCLEKDDRGTASHSGERILALRDRLKTERETLPLWSLKVR